MLPPSQTQFFGHSSADGYRDFLREVGPDGVEEGAYHRILETDVLARTSVLVLVYPLRGAM
jgi:hypothetical protein